jgi:hypothetical protein
MPRTTAGRWVVATLVSLALVALLSWARGAPGVGDRFPDPGDVPAPAEG